MEGLDLVTHVRAVVGDPHSLARLGVVTALRELDAVEVVGQAEDVDELLTLFDEHAPDLAVVDIELPGLGEGVFDMLKPLREVMPDIRLIVVSFDRSNEAIVRTFRSAAHGFIVKEGCQEHLPLAVPAVMLGGTFIDPRVAVFIVRQVLKGRRDYKGPFGLTYQQRRAVIFAGKGLTTPRIAKRMGLAPGTVSAHLYRAMTKLGVHDRHEAAAILEREGVAGPNF